jgi:protease I
MNRPKVLIIIGDATETVDTLYPYYRLIEGGYAPIVAGPEKRVFQMVMHEVKPGWTITKEWEGYSIAADIAFKDIKPEEYAGIFFSGGRAPEYIREDQDLLRITRWFWENKRPMASVCHGVEIPARAGIVKGLRMATVAKCKFDLEVCGGIYVNEPARAQAAGMASTRHRPNHAPRLHCYRGLRPRQRVFQPSGLRTAQ